MSEYKELDELKYKKLGESKDSEEKQRNLHHIYGKYILMIYYIYQNKLLN